MTKTDKYTGVFSTLFTHKNAWQFQKLFAMLHIYFRYSCRLRKTIVITAWVSKLRKIA